MVQLERRTSTFLFCWEVVEGDGVWKEPAILSVHVVVVLPAGMNTHSETVSVVAIATEWYGGYRECGIAASGQQEGGGV